MKGSSAFAKATAGTAEARLETRDLVCGYNLTMTSEARAYVKGWAETGRLLEELRWRELAAIDDQHALAAADALIDAALLVPLPATRRRSSGLVEQQSILHRAKPV